MSSEPFFSRWSRRKQAVRTAEPPPQDAVVPHSIPGESEQLSETAALQEPSEGRAPAEAEMSAEEIASLPSLEELSAETDISVFLRKGVPAPLRKAALRRVWSLDPKIRDFVGDAREYAYDWNTPGAVPGFGPLSATDDAVSMAERIVGGPQSDPGLPGVNGAENPVSPHSKGRERTFLSDAGANDAKAAASEENVASVPRQDLPCDTARGPDLIPTPSPTKVTDDPKPDAAAQPDRADQSETSAPVRRHGGAMPL